ncbi:hypothetical protein TSA66_00310 [Noviherbaspirillum autotrophicum]|uniref:Uncharacterized protein n=2 Tax=Noviherbaspirillum autotrophicum TaxID=709839 RepID=A0A0C2BW00_9BURK|nr:hypothetical protein TSA66_21040 [Noviherbaspirillum autotrophicum]KIF84199.1 hypothetical protein TSA66_00310 [Noviherbaspirillum autotrophicum]
MEHLRQQLVETAIAWERAFGNAPMITATLSEYDAARLVGMSIEQYSVCMQGATAVQRGYDFRFEGKRYQIKGNRPSGKPGSFVTMVPKATNYDWDRLIWILYDPQYRIVEAWMWEVDEYKARFDPIKRLSPTHYRAGQRLR